MIGIVGGMGPLAGLELSKEVPRNTLAKKDQDHIPFILVSIPEIPDRSEFLAGSTQDNPASPIAQKIILLGEIGATVVGLACNTAHESHIFDEAMIQVRKAGSSVKVMHLINEVVQFMIAQPDPTFRKVGVLCTTGTYKYKIYQAALEKAGFQQSLPGLDFIRDYVHESIYNEEYGIKSRFGKISKQTQDHLNFAIDWYRKNGCDTVVLGCTELSIVADSLDFQDMKVINPNAIFARAMIRETYPEKLREVLGD